MLTTPPPEVRAGALLVIGMGDIATLNSARVARAAGLAMRQAIHVGAKSAAFAPSLLDSGVAADAMPDAPQAMLAGVRHALAAERRLVDLGLARAPVLHRWTFDAGIAHLDAVEASFRAAFQAD